MNVRYQLKITRHFFVSLCTCITILSCSDQIQVARTLGDAPEIFPDYTFVTIPSNIAPLRFLLKDSLTTQAQARFEIQGQSVTVKAKDKQFKIAVSDWKKLMNGAEGQTLQITVTAKIENEWVRYAPFPIYIAREPIDPFIAYRLIEPLYETWNNMGIYQRNLENYTESAVITNNSTGKNCMNCHAFCMQDPDRMLFHLRMKYPGTLIMYDGAIEKLNTKTEKTISALVYPSWHPSGRYIAFSVNDTGQAFHASDPNRVEVFDAASDVVIYDREKHEIFTSADLFSDDAFETFPTFSPDGKTLYYCTAQKQSMPEAYEKVQYNLCAVTFDPEKRTIGTQVDTLYKASDNHQSVSFPRVSPNGKYLLFTLSGYGNFSIWHKDADLYLLNLQTREAYPLEAANSPDVESYHAWSSNSSWVVFSSRRIDGLYTRPYFAHIDDNGQAAKPFLLPQKDILIYNSSLTSYNIPEFIKGKIAYDSYTLSDVAVNKPEHYIIFNPE